MQIETPSRTQILQGVAAAAVFLTADVHLDVWQGGYKNLDQMGKLFMLNVVGGFTLGFVVLVWKHWLPALAAAGFGAATLAGFWFTYHFGLFDLPSTVFDYHAKLAMIYELVAIAAGLALAATLRRERRP